MHTIGKHKESESFGFLVSNAPGLLDTGLVIAGARSGATGVLNCENVNDAQAVRGAILRIGKLARRPIAIKLDADSALADDLLRELGAAVDCVIFTGSNPERLKTLVAAARPRRVLLEVTSAEQGAAGVALGVDGLIAKGHEAGGVVGEETTLVLLQRLLSECTVPVWAHGGIGLHSAAACYVAGAAGAVLEGQLLLATESSLPSKVRKFVERMEGDETICLGRELGACYRLAKRPGMSAVEQLQKLEQELALAGSPENAVEAWRSAICAGVAWRQPETDLWPLGQDAAFAAPLARRFRTVSGMVRGLREAIGKHVELAKKQGALGPGAPLAQFHGTEYPVLQGPMTRVSDTAQFAQAVAENGALPFLALALLRAPQVRKLLSETKILLAARPWGVGILGFVPADLRSEQLEAVREFRPPFAIIAGGRPDQAAGLERDGIRTYLHVPAPALLRMFLQDGARGFIFEGRECGGHVGPRTSFVLWDAMIEVLLDEIRKGVPPTELRVVFAGGIHDARSAAMVAAMAAPLAEQGVRIGVLLGTAYLFTEEAVSTGAIVEGFQQEALACRKTVLLESGPGHATRCVETPFYETFREQKRRLLAERKSAGEIREALENLNIGRLRVASKGVVRESDGEGSQPRYVEIPKEQQRLDGMYMIGQVAALRRTTCSMRDLHETVSTAGAALLGQTEAPARAGTETVRPAPCDVAIVGMSCMLPKAPDLQSFWRNVVNKVHAITEVPPERFNVDLFFDPDRRARDKIYSRWGGFLEDAPFDPMRYGIPPNALASIDPMQLLALVVVDRALADAGYRDRDFPRDKTSVIFGLSGGLGDLGIQYAVRSLLGQFVEQTPEALLAQLPEWTEDSFAGILPNVTAGRVANRFDLGGVNFAVDAACASSLAAVYLAARELTSSASDMVIVGGVDTVQSPFGYLCFSKSQALSPRGACRTFDATADGIAISEGISMLVLKRLADAERDGDRIYAVIKGVAGSSDGRGRSMTAPRLEGQIAALDRAYAQAGIRPSTVGLIEAHGTGTAAGDAAELAALTTVFAADGAAPQSCTIGSVKSMVGHTKSAAGVTGVMKAALALYHKTLPPTLHVEQPNAKLREPGSAFFVNSDPRPWTAAPGPEGEAAPRRAGVSSFGFGGTNFHAVLEEYQGDITHPADRATIDQWPAELFIWNAPAADALAAAMDQLAERLENRPPAALRDLAASVCARAANADSGLRLAIVASSIEDLLAKVRQAGDKLRAGTERIDDAKGVYLAPAGPRARIAFLFPGQGSQKPGMLRDLSLAFPEIRQSLERADAILTGRLGKNLSAYIYPPSAFTPDEERRQMQEITDTVVAQPALGAVEAALHSLLARCGVSPDMTAGHSYGEYVALYAAGVVTDEALFDLSETRGRAIRESLTGEAGTMAAVADGPDAVTQALGGLSGIAVANYNSPRQTVISGATDIIQSAVRILGEAGLSARLIPVACAFHSPLMQPARDRLAVALSRQNFSRPRVPVFSNMLGNQYPEAPNEIGALLADHLVKPVRFAEEIAAMYDLGARIFVEVGPKGVLSGLARQILEGKDARFIQLDGDRPGVTQFLHALAQLAVSGAPIETSELFRGRLTQIVDLDKPAESEPAQPGWMVNGGRVFRRGERPGAIVPVELARTPEPSPAAHASPPRNVAVPASPAPAAVVHAGGQATPGSVDAVMLQFQQLMSQFLETQTAVITGFLGAPAAATSKSIPQAPPAPALMMPSGLAAPLKPAAPATPPEVKAATQPAATAAVNGTARRDHAAELRKIASERTGYPVEMLDQDAGIEADLGIDSIKRVEILTAFQRLCSPSEQARVQGVMESLTSARTLREIAERLGAALANGAAPADSPAPPAKTVSAFPAPAHRDPAAELRRIASERTGYPAEMLDQDAGIEADLGIDSIKRVEILTAFQRLCSPSEQARVQGVMESLTSARTLREIADRLGTVLLNGSASNGHSRAAHAAPAAAQRDHAVELRRIASERTGYPADMLDPDAGIEADLGIDSIKRVEILTAFQRLCSPSEQAQVQGVMEALISARTLREIADRLAAALNPGPAVNGSRPQATGLTRCILTTVDRPRRHGSAQFHPGRVVLITDDETGVASRFAGELERAGERPVLVRHSPDAAVIAAGGVFSTDLTDPAAVTSVVEAIQKRYGTIGAVIHLLPLRPVQNGIPAGLAEWRQTLALDIKSLYALARATESNLKQTGRAGGALMAAVTARGGEFGLQPDAGALPSHHAIADFIKTLSLEFTGVLCKVADLDGSDPVPILCQKLVDELCSTDETLQVGLPGDRRLTVAPQMAPFERSPGTAALRHIGNDWVFLLTGGARGITAEIAKLLAARCHPTLILAGASPLPAGDEPAETAGITEPARLKAALTARMRASAGSVKPAEVEAAFQRLLKNRQIRQTLATLERAGSRVEYHALDVRDEASFGALLENIYLKHGRLDVVVHGAGIIEDKLIRDKTPDSFDRVLHTKADSAYLLSTKLRGESLQCLLFMSSISAMFGNRGQADYAAANGIMNGLAASLAARWPGRVVAMNWGPWDQSGMVSEETRQQFLARGVQVIPPAMGAEAALREMEAGRRDEVVVGLGDGPWIAGAAPAKEPESVPAAIAVAKAAGSGA